MTTCRVRIVARNRKTQYLCNVINLRFWMRSLKKKNASFSLANVILTKNGHNNPVSIIVFLFLETSFMCI